MNALALSFLGILGLPFVLLLARVVINAVVLRRARKRLRDAHHRGTRYVLPVDGHAPTSHLSPLTSDRYKLPRGECLLEALAAILFCACMAAVICVCLSDEEDLIDLTDRAARLAPSSKPLPPTFP